MGIIPWTGFSSRGRVIGFNSAFFCVFFFFSVGLGLDFLEDFNEGKLFWVYTYCCDVIDLSDFIFFLLQIFYFRS